MSKSVLDITKILNTYAKDIANDVCDEAQRVGKIGVDELRNTSPKKTGSYRKGWKLTTEKNQWNVRVVIHNATNYQLTHLLENGHTTRNGGRTKPIVHIAPVERQCNEEYLNSVIKDIQNGG